MKKMKRKFLLLLALALSGVAVQMNAQSSPYEPEGFYTDPGGTQVYMIKSSTTPLYWENLSYETVPLCRDYDGNPMALPMALDDAGNPTVEYCMKFRVLTEPTLQAGASWGTDNVDRDIVPGTVAVYSYAGSRGYSTYTYIVGNPNIEYGTNLATNHKGEIVVPSKVYLIDANGNYAYPYNVVQVDPAAFFQCHYITSIKAHCKYLSTIGDGAFAHDSKSGPAYTSVDIKTDQFLNVGASAFNAYVNTTTWQGADYDLYFDDTRDTYLKTVTIDAKGGMDIKASFLFNNGLEKVTLTSSDGPINLAYNSFGVQTLPMFKDPADGVVKNQTDISTNTEKESFTGRPRPDIWNRGLNADYADDGVYITGKGVTIGEGAFAGHVNFQQVIINDTRTATEADGNEMTIGQAAFRNCFNGTGSKGKVEIIGPIKDIAPFSFIVYSPLAANSEDDGIYGPGKGFRPDGATYASSLTTVHIKNTGKAPLGINPNSDAGAFQSHFAYQEGRNVGKATIHIEGLISKIGNFAFYALADNKYNGLTRGTNISIENIDLSGMGVTPPELTIGNSAFNSFAKHPDETNYPDNWGTLSMICPSEMIIGNSAFQNNSRLATMKYKHTSSDEYAMNTLPDKVIRIGNHAFSSNSYPAMTIPQLTLKGSGTAKTIFNGETIPANADDDDVYNVNQYFGYSVFRYNKKLKEVTILNESTGKETFADCSFLEKVTLGDKVRYLQHRVFYNISEVFRELRIPKSVQVIGHEIVTSGSGDNSADRPCRIIFESKQPPYALKDAFTHKYYYTAPNTGIHIVVPRGSVSSYMFSATTTGKAQAALENQGFQNVQWDNISCEYTLPAAGWGSLGMTAHTVSQYEASFTAYDAAVSNPETIVDYRLTSLDTEDRAGKTLTKVKNTDVYDTRRIGKAGTSGNSMYYTTSEANAKIYTADYYYNESGKVGLDKITNYAVVPQSTSTTDRNIGYLVNGEPGTYYLHHYNGGTMTHKLTAYDYNTVFTEAKTCFDSEDIPKPGALRNGANDTSYSRTTAPNLLVAWDESHTGYAQGTTFKVGGSFGDTPCNYYGYDPATDKFRKLSATTWAKMKEGIAFLVVPTSLLGSDGTGSGKATLGVFITGDDDNDNGTTGINVNVDRNGNGNVDCWYTLQGVRLAGKPTVSGIYIHNGRKEVVK